MRSLACFVGVGGEGWHHASWRRFFGAAAEVSCLSERADITHHGAGFGAAAEVSCLSERADIMHHGAGFLVQPPKSPACRRG